MLDWATQNPAQSTPAETLWRFAFIEPLAPSVDLLRLNAMPLRCRNHVHARHIDIDIDIDVEDVDVRVIADADLGALQEAGLRVSNRTDHYGFAIEATITDGREQTQLEWSEADRARFFTIQSHPTFGWALHKADLAIQKLIAGASRREARDMVDLLLIEERYMPLAIAAIAAPAKAPGTSPIDLLERARRIAMGHPAEDVETLRLAADSGRRITPTTSSTCRSDRRSTPSTDADTGTGPTPERSLKSALIRRGS